MTETATPTGRNEYADDARRERESVRAWMKSRAVWDGRKAKLSPAEVEAYERGAFDPLSDQHVYKRIMGHVTNAGAEHYDSSGTAVIDRSLNEGRLRMVVTKHATVTQDKFIVPYDTDADEMGEIVAETDPHSEKDIPTDQAALSGFQLSSKLVRVHASLVFTVRDYDLYVLQRCMRRIGRAEEFYALQGTGTNEPNGLVNTAPDSGVTLTAGAFAYDELVSVHQSINQDYRDNAIWIMHPDHAAAAKNVTGSDGRPAYFPQTPDGEWLPSIFGHPVLETSRAPTSHIFFGDPSYIHYRESEEVKLHRSAERYAENNQLCFAGIITFDSQLTVKESFSKSAVA